MVCIDLDGPCHGEISELHPQVANDQSSHVIGQQLWFDPVPNLWVIQFVSRQSKYGYQPITKYIPSGNLTHLLKMAMVTVDRPIEHADVP